MMTSWYGQLDRAKSIPEVISVVRDYLATWTPEEIALLPEQCRPTRVRGEVDVEALHSALVEEYRSSRASGKDLEMLQRMTSFIVRTSIRFAELAPPSSAGRSEDPAGPAKSLAPPEG